MEANPVTRIREAVAAAEYRRAEQLWNEYAAQLRERIRQGSFTPECLEELRALIDWTRTVVLCARSHAQDRLNNLVVAAKYDSAPSATPARLLQVRI